MADGAHAIRVDVVFVRVCPDPLDRPLGILQLRRPRVGAVDLAEEPIAGHERHVALLGHPARPVAVLERLAEDQATAVEEHEHDADRRAAPARRCG
jgi:hypothetical protein